MTPVHFQTFARCNAWLYATCAQLSDADFRAFRSTLSQCLCGRPGCKPAGRYCQPHRWTSIQGEGEFGSQLFGQNVNDVARMNEVVD
jgi:hypothetical protein